MAAATLLMLTASSFRVLTSHTPEPTPEPVLKVTPNNLLLTPVEPPKPPEIVPDKRTQKARVFVRSQSKVSGFEAHEDDIWRCESTYGTDLQNPSSTASGHYGITDGTWDGYKGYDSAKDAPRDVQRERAKQIYAERGIQPWRASAGCRAAK